MDCGTWLPRFFSFPENPPKYDREEWVLRLAKYWVPKKRGLRACDACLSISQISISTTRGSELLMWRQSRLPLAITDIQIE